MKQDNIIYWACTGLVSALMLFSAFAYFTKPEMAEAFKHLGFPDYFRIELGIAKILGVIALLVPMISSRLKEWAYFGFSVVCISAIIAHLSSGDGMGGAGLPLFALVLLCVSYIYYHKLQATPVV